jgi:hypothetical protein
VDKTIEVAVFNGSGTSGLGRRAGDKLKAAGWTVAEPQTWTGDPVSVTTVYFGASTQRASAQSIVRTLGKGSVKLSAAKAGAGITVVIGPDFPGATGSPATRTRSSTTRAGSSTTRSATSTSSASSTTPGASGSPTTSEDTPTTSTSPTESTEN